MSENIKMKRTKLLDVILSMNKSHEIACKHSVTCWPQLMSKATLTGCLIYTSRKSEGSKICNYFVFCTFWMCSYFFLPTQQWNCVSQCLLQDTNTVAQLVHSGSTAFWLKVKLSLLQHNFRVLRRHTRNTWKYNNKKKKSQLTHQKQCVHFQLILLKQ